MATAAAGCSELQSQSGCRRRSGNNGRIKLSRELMLRLSRALSEIKPPVDCDLQAATIVTAAAQQASKQKHLRRTTSGEAAPRCERVRPREESTPQVKHERGQSISSGHVGALKEHVCCLPSHFSSVNAKVTQQQQQQQHHTEALNGSPRQPTAGLESPRLKTTRTQTQTTSERNKGYYGRDWPALRHSPAHHNSGFVAQQRRRTFTWPAAVASAKRRLGGSIAYTAHSNKGTSCRKQRRSGHARQPSALTSTWPAARHDAAKDLWPSASAAVAGAGASSGRAARGRRIGESSLRCCNKVKESKRQIDKSPQRLETETRPSAQMDRPRIELRREEEKETSRAESAGAPTRHLGCDGSRCLLSEQLRSIDEQENKIERQGRNSDSKLAQVGARNEEKETKLVNKTKKKSQFTREHSSVITCASGSKGSSLSGLAAAQSSGFSPVENSQQQQTCESPEASPSCLQESDACRKGQMFRCRVGLNNEHQTGESSGGRKGRRREKAKEKKDCDSFGEKRPTSKESLKGAANEGSCVRLCAPSSGSDTKAEAGNLPLKERDKEREEEISYCLSSILKLAPAVWPTALLATKHRYKTLIKLLTLLLLTLQLLPVVLTPSGGRASGFEQQPSGSDELSRAVLATMSTQSPPPRQQHVPGSSSDENLFAAGSGSLQTNGTEVDAHPNFYDGEQKPDKQVNEIGPIGAGEADWYDGPFMQFGRIFIMGAIIVGDICGNSLVILSVCRHSKLRVTTNWFVVSLACADILVALFAMTFNASVIISGRWLFKPWVCDFWNSCDVLASTASILHLCCISIDRYIAITRPLDYPMKITTRRVVYALCAVWISSALLSYIPIFTGIYTTAEHIKWQKANPDQCEFVVNRVYAIVSSSISFWIPCCIMVFTYYRIYKEATRQEKFIYKAQSMMPAPMPNHHGHHHHHHGHGHHSNNHLSSKSKQRRSKSVAVGALGVGAPQSQQSNEARIRLLAKQQQQMGGESGKASGRTTANSSSIATTRLTGSSQDSTGGGDKASSIQAIASSMQQLDATTDAAGAVDLNNNSADQQQQGQALVKIQQPAPAAPLREEPEECDSSSGQSTPTKRSISKMKREHKAAKTLGIIMGVFILCWLPFFSWYTPQNICGSACHEIVPRGVVTILFWIGYFNSTLNPIIYAYFNHEFRDAFKKTLQWIFCCCQDLKCLRVNRPNDNQHYNCTYRSTQEIGLVSNG